MIFFIKGDAWERVTFFIGSFVAGEWWLVAGGPQL